MCLVLTIRFFINWGNSYCARAGTRVWNLQRYCCEAAVLTSEPLCCPKERNRIKDYNRVITGLNCIICHNVSLLWDIYTSLDIGILLWKKLTQKKELRSHLKHSWIPNRIWMGTNIHWVLPWAVPQPL